MPHHRVQDHKDNLQQIVLPEYLFSHIAASAFANPLKDRIREASEKEAEVLEALEKLKSGGLKRLANGLPEWEEDNGLVYHHGRVYVPPDLDIRKEVLRQCHDAPTAGHPGIHATFDLVSSNYWWPTMRSFVDKYVEGCDTCARKKLCRHPRAVTHPLDVPQGVWEGVDVDLITQLPMSNGFDAILVCTNLYSKQVHAIPCLTSINAEGVADLYYQEIFRLHGLPSYFVSDHGPQFAAAVMRKLLKRLGINSNLTSVYQPQANGQTEQANQEVEKYLRLYIGRRQTDWAKHLAMAEFVMNARTHLAHGLSPFEAIYGYQPLFNIPVGQRTGHGDVDERIEKLEKAREDARVALEAVKKEQKAGYEWGKNKAHVFKVGDFVWLDSRDINLKTPSRKFTDRQLGPFEVLEKVGDLDYCLKLPFAHHRLHPVFHVDKLSPYRGNEINGKRPEEPGPIELEEDGAVGEYEVEEVLNSWIMRRKLEYEICWSGWGAEEITCESAEDCRNAQELVDKFHREHPDAVTEADIPPPPQKQRRRR